MKAIKEFWNDIVLDDIEEECFSSRELLFYGIILPLCFVFALMFPLVSAVVLAVAAVIGTCLWVRGYGKEE